MNRQLPRDTGSLFQFRERGCLINTVFRHVAIGRPLSTGDREQSRTVNVDGVVTRQRRGVLAVPRFDQRPDSREHAQNVRPLWRSFEISTRRFQNEIDLVVGGSRFNRRIGNRDVRRSDDGVIVPGNREHHSAIRRVWDHDGIIAWQERTIEDEMNSLTWSDQPHGVGIDHSANTVAERASGVHDNPRQNIECAIGLAIMSADTGDKSVLIADQSIDLGIVHDRRALFDGRLSQVDQQS